MNSDHCHSDSFVLLSAGFDGMEMNLFPLCGEKGQYKENAYLLIKNHPVGILNVITY